MGEKWKRQTSCGALKALKKEAKRDEGRFRGFTRRREPRKEGKRRKLCRQGDARRGRKQIPRKTGVGAFVNNLLVGSSMVWLPEREGHRRPYDDADYNEGQGYAHPKGNN